MPVNNVVKSDKRTKTKTIIVTLPSLVRVANFNPTAKMLQVISKYLQILAVNPLIKPTDIVKQSKDCSLNTWYTWQKKPGFCRWFDEAVTEYFESSGLTCVHKRIYERAMDNSPQDSKLMLERFDRKYKPQQRLEHVVGHEPPEDNQQGAVAARSEERRQFVDSSEEKQAKTA